LGGRAKTTPHNNLEEVGKLIMGATTGRPHELIIISGDCHPSTEVFLHISYNSSTMNLHLFSTPGKDELRTIVDASRPYLEGKDNPVVAYLPAASLSNT